jgi:hypothetical protein
VTSDSLLCLRTVIFVIYRDGHLPVEPVISNLPLTSRGIFSRQLLTTTDACIIFLLSLIAYHKRLHFVLQRHY